MATRVGSSASNRSSRDVLIASHGLPPPPPPPPSPPPSPRMRSRSPPPRLAECRAVLRKVRDEAAASVPQEPGQRRTDWAEPVAEASATEDCEGRAGKWPPLLKAVYDGDLPRVRELLHAGEDVNCTMPGAGQKTPIYYAVRFEHTEIARLLLTIPGIDVHRQMRSGRGGSWTTPIEAAKEGGTTSGIYQVFVDEGLVPGTTPRRRPVADRPYGSAVDRPSLAIAPRPYGGAVDRPSLRTIFAPSCASAPDERLPGGGSSGDVSFGMPCSPPEEGARYGGIRLAQRRAMRFLPT